MTLNLELGSNKSGKGARPEFGTHSPDALDSLFRHYLREALYTPTQLLLHTRATTLFDAVKPRTPAGPSGWPTTDELRGKFVVVVHGDEDDVRRYFGSSPVEAQKRACFLLDENRWRDWPPERFATEAPHIVFHGEVDTKGVAARLRKTLPGHILRSKQIDDCNAQDCRGDTNRARVAEAQRAGMNMLYTNMGSVHDRAFRTVNDTLYPFGASLVKADGTYPAGDEAWQHPAAVGKTEPGRVFVLGDKAGGDLGGNADKFVFASLSAARSGPESWITEVASASNGSVHPHGKGFLMARASTAANAPYCAVGRTADRYGMRFQYRSDYGLGTAFEEQFGNYGISGAGNRRERENYHFMKLEVVPTEGGRSTVCRGYVSYTGQEGTWQQVGPDATFSGLQLSSIGLAVASNSGFNADNVRTYPPGAYTKFFFVDLRRAVGDGPLLPMDLDRLQVSGVGGSGDPFILRLAVPDSRRE